MELGILIVAMVAFVFLVPIQIRLSGDLEESRIEAGVRVALGFGTLSVRAIWADGALLVRPVVLGVAVWTLRPGGGKPKAKKPKPDEVDKADEEEKATVSQKGWRERVNDILEYDRRFRRPALRLLGRLPGVIRFRRLAIRGRYGADTAEATGSVYGYVCALDAVTSDRLQLDVEPDFQLSGFRGAVRVDLTFHLARLLRAVVRAALSMGVRYLAMILGRRFGRRRRSAAQAA